MIEYLVLKIIRQKLLVHCMGISLEQYIVVVDLYKYVVFVVIDMLILHMENCVMNEVPVMTDVLVELIHHYVLVSVDQELHKPVHNSVNFPHAEMA